MSKISYYPSADEPLQLSDRLIGTEAPRPTPSPTPLATKNFSLGELLDLFSSNFPAASLQAVLNTGNTATQNITLVGTITSTVIKPTNIEDTSGSQGTTFQVLSKGASSINWVSLPVDNLQAVLDSGNTATQNINLVGDITSTKIIPGNIQDDTAGIGTVGQVLSKTSTGIRWITNPASYTAGLNDVLSIGNISNTSIFIQDANYSSEVNTEYVKASDLVLGRYAFLSADGYIGLGNGAVGSTIKSTNITQSITLELPNKTAGTYTIATTDDIPTTSFIPHATASGTDTYTATVSGITSYSDGDAYLIRFTNGNTTGCTLNINGLGAVPLYKNNDGPLIGGDIWAGGEMLCIYNSSSNIFQCIGTSPNSLFSYVTNADTVPITKGMPVYAFGGQGDRLTVKRAFNTSDATSAQTVGIVLTTSIGVNQKGVIIMQGLLDGLSILPTSTWADGDPIYLAATAGNITKTKQYAPNHLVYLGFVTNASNGSAGRWYVRVQNGYELDELHNVQAQSPSVNDILYYFGGSPGQWKTASIPAVLGYTPANRAGDTFTGNIDAPSMSLNGVDLESLMIAYAVALG